LVFGGCTTRDQETEHHRKSAAPSIAASFFLLRARPIVDAATMMAHFEDLGEFTEIGRIGQLLALALTVS